MAGVEDAILHVVTNDEMLARSDVLPLSAGIMRAGGTGLAFHLRGGSTDAATLFALGDALLRAATASGASLVVNDRVDVALALGAHGVHLGRRSLPPHRVRALVGDTMSVGLSCHASAEVRSAREAGADYAFFGTVYPTASHPDREGAGISALAEAVTSSADVPVVAIGGITSARLAEVARTGVSGVAVISGVWDAEDPAEAVHRYISGLAPLGGAVRSGDAGSRIDRPARRG